MRKNEGFKIQNYTGMLVVFCQWREQMHFMQTSVFSRNFVLFISETSCGLGIVVAFKVLYGTFFFKLNVRIQFI